MKSGCCHSSKIIFLENGPTLCHNPSCENYLAPTSLQQSLKVGNQLFTGLLLIFFFIMISDDYSNAINPHKQPENAILSFFNPIPLTSENVKKELNRQQLLCQDQVFAQIMIESGRLNSLLTKKAHNLTGMRYPFRRSTTAIGLYLPDKGIVVLGSQKELLCYQKQNNYAVYNDWPACIADYKIWQTTCFNLNDRYMAFLGSHYAEDQDYTSKIMVLTNGQ